jgi:uncharacterized phage protein (TIGR02216 family)
VSGGNAGGAGHYPFDDHLRVALGVVGWSPYAFWRATPRELWLAFDGYQQRLGVKRLAPVSRVRLAKLMREYPDR